MSSGTIPISMNIPPPNDPAKPIQSCTWMKSSSVYSDLNWNSRHHPISNSCQYIQPLLQLHLLPHWHCQHERFPLPTEFIRSPTQHRYTVHRALMRLASLISALRFIEFDIVTDWMIYFFPFYIIHIHILFCLDICLCFIFLFWNSHLFVFFFVSIKSMKMKSIYVYVCTYISGKEYYIEKKIRINNEI